MNRRLKIHDYIINNRYVFYVVDDVFTSVFTWLIYAILFKREYLSFQGEGVTFLFILLWICYPCSFYSYELIKSKRNLRK